MILTTRKLRSHIKDLKSFGCDDVSMLVIKNQQEFLLQIVPFHNGQFIDSEALLLFITAGKPKTFKTTKSVFNFAERYGIDYRLVYFRDGAL